MAVPPAVIVGWARSAVAPHGGAFGALQPHDIATPVLHGLLARSGVPPTAVDALVLGNALGAGGNPARMLALAAGLPLHCASYSVDTQCCSGLDAVQLAVGLLASGQASVVLAGGVEAWSRAPIRQRRPLHAGEVPTPYERPAFAPNPAQDPDLITAAAAFAAAQGYTRAQQDAYALRSHQRAIEHAERVAQEIVPVNGLLHDAYPRAISAARAARLPLVAASALVGAGRDCGLSTLSISTRADAAALLLLATPQACQRLGCVPQATWLAAASTGLAPEMPLLAAEAATRAVLARLGLQGLSSMVAVELHDAFAVQGLSFCQALAVQPGQINQRGGGLARGHPIAASGAVALVRLLADLQQAGSVGAHGLVAIAGAGGIGSAAVVEWQRGR